MHLLASIKKIVMEIPEPHRMALIKRANEKGIMYKLRCMNPKGLKTRYDGVDRTFKPDEEKIVPAFVAAFLIQTYNVDMVAGSATHPGGRAADTPAPFQDVNFDEVVDANRQDLGPDLEMVKGGVSLASDLLKEIGQSYVGKRGRTQSEDVGSEEIASVIPTGPSGKPRPVTTTEV